MYQSLSGQLGGQAEGGWGQKPSGEAVVTSLSFYDENDNECFSFETGKPMKAVLNYRVDKPLTDVIFEVQFYSQEGRLQSFFSSETLGQTINVDPGEGSISFDCSSVGLGPGVYFIDTGIRHRLRAVRRRHRLAPALSRCANRLRSPFARHILHAIYLPALPAASIETCNEK